MYTFIAWYLILTGVFYNRIDELRGFSSLLWPFYLVGVMYGIMKILGVVDTKEEG